MAIQRKKGICCCFPKCRIPIFYDLVTEGSYSRFIHVGVILSLFIIISQWIWTSLGDLYWAPALIEYLKQHEETGLNVTVMHVLSNGHAIPLTDIIRGQTMNESSLFEALGHAMQRSNLVLGSSDPGDQTQNGNSQTAQRVVEALLGFALLFGNAFTQHWITHIVSTGFLGAYLWRNASDAADMSESLRKIDAFHFILHIVLSCIFGILVLAYLYLLVLRLLGKPTSFIEERNKNYRDLVKRLLRSRNLGEVNETTALLIGNDSMEYESSFRVANPPWWKKAFSDLIELKSKLLKKDHEFRSHVQYETSTDFYYPQRLQSACALSIYFCLFAATYITFVTAFLWALVLPLLEDYLGVSALNIVIHVTKYAAPAFAYLVFLVASMNWVMIFRNYRHNIMLLRQAQFEIDKTKYNIYAVQSYIGYQVAHSLFAYVVVFLALITVVIFIVLVILVKAFQNFLIKFITGTLIIAIVNMIINRLMKTLIFTQEKGRLVNNFRFFGFSDYINTFISSVTGLMVCFSRLATAVALILLNFTRLDTPILSRSFEHMDGGYSSYIAMLLIDAQYNNPIGVTFVDFMIQAAEVNKEKNAKKLKARNRWHLAYTLIKNPSLVKYRVRQSYVSLESVATLPSIK